MMHSGLCRRTRAPCTLFSYRNVVLDRHSAWARRHGFRARRLALSAPFNAYLKSWQPSKSQKMMFMQHIITRGTLQRAASVGRLLPVVAVHDLPQSSCRCAHRPPPPHPAGWHWFSTSSSRMAAHQPKHQPPGGGTSTSSPETDQQDCVEEVDPLQDKSIGLAQRFKKTFKQYGKVMIPVHLVTSSFWFGTFYYAAMKGVNVVQFLEMINVPESLVGLLRDSSSGYALTAYALYKIATPARYAVTLGGTSLSVQYFRKHGYLSTPPPVKEYFQDKMEETKERFSEKMEETKERFSEKMEETKDKLSGKLQETKDRVSEGKAFFRKKNE
ncbi:protein FAM210A-like [Vanacampus margaritifer]